MSTHTSTRKGTPVLCIMNDGTHIEGKFNDKKNGIIILDGGVKVQIKDLRAMTIRKLKGEVQNVHQSKDSDK